MMKWLRNQLLGSFLIGVSATLCLTSKTLTMDQVRDSEVEYSMAKAISTFDKQEYENHIKEVGVSLCLSLQDVCISRIYEALKDANQFIIFFMHRFSSCALTRILEEKYIESVPVVLFLDGNQTYINTRAKVNYSEFIGELRNNIPSSLLELGNRDFFHRIIITKKLGQQAITIIGSADSIFEANDSDSQDLLFIQSNRLAYYFVEAFQRQIEMLVSDKLSSKYSTKRRVLRPYEYQFHKGKSNLEFLSDLKELLVTNDPRPSKGYMCDVVSFAVSPELSRCRTPLTSTDIILRALNDPNNKLLLLFGDFFRSPEGSVTKQLREALKTNSPKLIVLNKSKKNAAASDNFKDQNTEVVMFQPYTGGKLSHNLLIQYPYTEDPIIYSGSFHLPTCEESSYSDNVIGIRSRQLADDYLSSIVSSSGLDDVPTIWKFFLNFERLGMEFKGTKVERIAQQVLLRCKLNIDGYLDRLEQIHDNLKSIASDVGEQIDITPYFEQFIKDFQVIDMQKKIRALVDLKNNILRNNLNQTYLRALNIKWEILKTKVYHLEMLPIYIESKLDQWLEQMRLWLEKSKTNINHMEVNIRDDINDMTRIWFAISNLNDYEHKFKNFYELNQVLEELCCEQVI